MNRDLLMKSLADSKRAGERLEREEAEDEPVLIEEDYTIKDDGVTVIDMALRHRLATPNVDPAEYWTKAVATRHSKPRLGNNIYLDHISNSRVSALTVRRMSDRGAVLRVHHLLPRNAGIEFSDESSKRLKIQGRGESTSVNMG